MRGLSVTEGVGASTQTWMWTCARHSCAVTQKQPCCIPEPNTGHDASEVARSAVVLVLRCCLHPYFQHQVTLRTRQWPFHVCFHKANFLQLTYSKNNKQTTGTCIGLSTTLVFMLIEKW